MFLRPLQLGALAAGLLYFTAVPTDLYAQHGHGGHGGHGGFGHGGHGGGHFDGHGGHFGGHGGFGHGGLGHGGIGHGGFDHGGFGHGGIGHHGLGHDIFGHHGYYDHHGFGLYVSPYLYGFGFGYGYPGYNYGYGYPFDYYDYGYPYSYYAPTYIVEGGSDYADSRAQPYREETPPRTEENAPIGTEAGQEFLDRAQAAFRQGSYGDAARLAGHAAVEMPRNAEVHQFMALAMFALTDYRGAASAGHAALSLGQPWDWPTVRGFYARADDYTSALRALEKYVRDNPSAAYARFLLGYHYLILGHEESARRHLARAVELQPSDELARRLLEDLGGTPPESRAPQGQPQPSPEAPAPPDSEDSHEGHQHSHGQADPRESRPRQQPEGLDSLALPGSGSRAPSPLLMSDSVAPWTVDAERAPKAGSVVDADGAPGGATPTDTEGGLVDPELQEVIRDSLAELSAADRAAAQRQRVCPVTGDLLGSVGKPIKTRVRGQDVFVCCQGCIKDLRAQPEKYLAGLATAEEQHSGTQHVHPGHDH